MMQRSLKCAAHGMADEEHHGPSHLKSHSKMDAAVTLTTLHLGIKHWSQRPTLVVQMDWHTLVGLVQASMSRAMPLVVPVLTQFMVQFSFTHAKFRAIMKESRHMWQLWWALLHLQL